MKKFFKFAAIAAIAAAFVGCNKTDDPVDDGKDPGTTTPTYTEDIAFTLEEKEVEDTKAKFGVAHTGTKSDTWYYFATTENDIEAAIQAVLASGKVDLENATKKNVTVRDLEPETAYTFVVFAVKADGTLYGEPATADFTTTKTPEETPDVPPTPPTTDEMTINPNWSVAYSGAQEYEGTVYEHTATVTSTDENPWFLSAAYEKEMFDAAVAEYGLTAIAQAELDGFKDYVKQINEYYDQNFTAVDLAYVGTEWDVINIQAGKEYVVMAIGIGADSELSMLYAISDVIKLEEEDMTEAYAAWLGNWTFTGANGISQTVTFSKGVANQTYKMTGYEGQNLEVEVLWDEESQAWMIYNQLLGKYNFSGGKQGDIWFIGEDANEKLFLSDQLPICLGGMFEDGTLGCIAFEGELETNTGIFEYAVADMLFIADFGNQQLSYISKTYETGYPTFPMTITAASAPSSTRSVEKGIKHSSKFMAKPCTFNCFAADFNIL